MCVYITIMDETPSEYCDLPATFVPGFHDVDTVRKMKYTTLGKTGLEVSIISLGGSPFGYHYGNFDEQEAIKTIYRAVKSGVNYIDTAPWYGQGKSENFLGRALRDIPRSAYYICTKVGRYEADVNKMFDWSAHKTKASVKRSMQRLGVDYLDVVQIHDVEFCSDVDVLMKDTLKVLLEFLNKGKIHFIGCTGYDLDMLKYTVSHMLKYNHGCSVVLTYARNTMFDSELDSYIDWFKAQELGVICASGHGMGLLTNNGPPVWHPAGYHIRILCRKAVDYCKARGVEIGRLAMYHFIRMVGPHTFLIGMRTTKNLFMNLDVYYNGLTAIEKECYQFLMSKIFHGRKMNWQGIEVAKYFADLEGTSYTSFDGMF